MKGVNPELAEAVRTLEIPQAGIDLFEKHPPLILAAITAAGKNAVANRIIEKSDYERVITHTTRDIRPDETNGVDYWFVSQEQMLGMIRSGALVEAQVIHSDTVYGTSIEAYRKIVDEGHKPLLIMDIQGVQRMLTELPELRPYFILPPDYDEWMNRLHKRGAMSHQQKENRLRSAKNEIEIALSDPHFVLVINREIEDTANAVLEGPVRINQRDARQVSQWLLEHIKV